MLEQRGATIVRQHPGVGEVRGIGRSTWLSVTPLDPLFPAPLLGTYSHEVVEEVGFGDRFAELVAAGAIAVPAVPQAGAAAG